MIGNNTPKSVGSALVLLLGGQDSTVVLVWALGRYARVEPVGFDYGQRHVVELEQRLRVLHELLATFPSLTKHLSDDRVIDLGLLKSLGMTAMTHDVEIVMQANGRPSTFVSGRNLLFLTVAAVLAYRCGLHTLISGMCETDYGGYPNGREQTIQAQQKTLALGMDCDMAIETPLMWSNKAETWAMAYELGGRPLVDLIVEHSHTCYQVVRTVRHPWGYGCGECPACALRQGGWERWTATTDAMLAGA